MRIAHGCWLRPHQGQGQGLGGEQREEEPGASIWRDSQFGASCQGASCHARCKHSSPALPCFVEKPGQEGWLPLPAELSIFFPFSLSFQKLLQITRNGFFNFESPGIAGTAAPAIFRVTRTKILLLFQSPAGCTTLGMENLMAKKWRERPLGW